MTTARGGAESWNRGGGYPNMQDTTMVVIKDLLKNYIKALGPNQAYTSLKLCNNYYSVNMFIWIDSGKYITAIYTKRFICFFLYLDNTDGFQLILKMIVGFPTL